MIFQFKGQKEAEEERERRIRAEKTLMAMKSFLFDYFHQLGSDPMKNIDVIVETVGKALHAAAALYNRLEGGVLKTWSVFQEPPGYEREDHPEGHICYSMTIRERGPANLTPVVIPDLEGSKWETLDPNVKKYDLKSYLAFPVLLGKEVVGSLCVVDTRKRKYEQIELDILEAFAAAVQLEEERKQSLDSLTQANQEVKMLSGMLPICAACKKIRDDKGYWNQIEMYIQDHADVEFSHGLCPECAEKLLSTRP